MKNRKRLKQVLGLAMLVLVLVGCSGGRVEPTAVSQTHQALIPTIFPTLISSIPTTIPAAPIQAELQITKYPGNYTCFKFETSQGVILITDPYEMDEDVQADIVTVSHDHSDHADFSHIKGEYQIIDTVDTFDEKGVKITGVAGRHNKGDTSITNIIYIFDMDGIRLAQFASQGELPTEAMFTQIGKVDILIIQIYGAGNGKLSVEEANSIAQRLQARIVIPAHTDTRQTDILASLMGGKIEEIVTGKLVVTKAGLAEQQTPKVVVLDVP
jgi:hypothetical protein